MEKRTDDPKAQGLVAEHVIPNLQVECYGLERPVYDPSGSHQTLISTIEDTLLISVLE